MQAFHYWQQLQTMSKAELSNWLVKVFARTLNEKPTQYATNLGTPIQSAVLIPLIVRNGSIQILLTKRSLELRHHQGQVCFPGGKKESSDEQIADTAKRESYEELGIPATQIQIIGQLSTLSTVSNYEVFPFVGIIPADIPYRIDPNEVAEVLELPIAYLINPAHHFSYDIRRPHRDIRVPGLRFGKYHIWGATAWILNELRDFLLANPPQ